MKLVKIIIAGVVAGVLIFMWSFMAHMMLQLFNSTMLALPAEKEAIMLSTIRENVTGPGMYYLPGLSQEAMRTNDPVAMAAWEEKRRAGASGLLIVAPFGEGGMTTMMLVKELATDVAAAILVALVIFWGVPHSGPFRTVGMSIAMGLMSWFLISTSYNIWYRFPRDFIIAEGITEVVGLAIAGVAIYIVGLILKPKKKTVEKDLINDTV